MIETGQRQAWVSEAQRGDALAVSKLLAKYHSVLRGRVEVRMDRGLKGKFEPEDILQEVYLEVFQHIDRFEDRGPDSFLNWVLTIVDNKLIDIRRALYCQRRDIAREVCPGPTDTTASYGILLDELNVDSATPSRAVRHEEALGALMVCLSRLSDSYRQVLQMRFLEGYSVAEAAERLAKSPAVIVALTRSALRALRESMDRLGEFSRGV